jgi:predicted CoA-binding protein
MIAYLTAAVNLPNGIQVGSGLSNGAAPYTIVREEGGVGPVEALIREFVNQRVWALVGASADRSKYGNRILKDLHAAGYTIYPVSLRETEIEGLRAYPTLADLPELPQVVDIVVPPRVTEKIVRQCAELRLSRIWMQPGAESEEAIVFCQDNHIRVVHHACAMEHKRQW